MTEYQLQTPPLGSGGTAIVQRGVIASDGRVIAVKRPISAAANEQLRAEAAVLASLQHPNIVRFLGCEEREDEVRLLQEYVDGVDLRYLLAKVGALPPSAAIYVVRELLAGLDYLHERGFVHRDLAPANVLLGRDGTVKLADFGLAKLADSEPTTARLVRGTLRYLSPEQADGGELDRRSDLFVVGLLFHEMVTGEPVFHGATDGEILAKVLGNRPITISASSAREIPAVIKPVVERLLKRKRSERYASARAVLDALPASPYGRAELTGLQGKQIHSSTESPAIQDARLSRRRRKVLWGAGVAFAVLGLAAAVWHAYPVGAELDEPNAQPATNIVAPLADTHTPTPPVDDGEEAPVADRAGEIAVVHTPPQPTDEPIKPTKKARAVPTAASRAHSTPKHQPATSAEPKDALPERSEAPDRPYQAPSRTYLPAPRGVYKGPSKTYYPEMRDDAGTKVQTGPVKPEPTEPEQG